MLWLWCQTYWVCLTENPLKCLILYWSWQEFPPLNPFGAPRRSAHIKQKGAPLTPRWGWCDVMLTNPRWKKNKKMMEKSGPLSSQEGGLWAGSCSCDTWENQNLWKAVTLQPQKHYNCLAVTEACILTWCVFCFFIGLVCLGFRGRKVCNLAKCQLCSKCQLCLVSVNGLIMVESHLQALSTWIL